MKSFLVLASVALAIAATPAVAGKGVNNGGGNNNGNSNNNGGGSNGGGGGGIVTLPAAPRICSTTDVSPTALACTGFVAGNLLSGNAGDIAAQKAGLSAIGLVWDGVFANVTKINSLGGLTTVDFSTADQNPLARLYGETWVGLHFGNGAGLGGNATAFYKFDAGAAGLTSFLLNIARGSSGAVVYSTKTSRANFDGMGGASVPEPASWAMMIAGFGLVGASMRRHRPVFA